MAHTFKRQLLAGVLTSAACVHTAMAQTAPSSPAAVQEVVVTGSRIPRINEKSANPVSVVSNEDVKLQGQAHVEDVLNELPQINAGLNSAALAPTGTATVDLRGFGAFRTLVLINGRRLNPGDPFNPSSDINSVPDALIKRVEVLTGGASSIYGSDAIAGVVNFVMDDNFQGLRLDAQYGGALSVNRRDDLQALARASGAQARSSDVFDGPSLDLNGAYGHDLFGGAGHLTLYGGYRKTDAIRASSRDYSACNLIETGKTFGCIKDDNSNPAQFRLAQGAYTLDAATGNTFRNFNSPTDGFNTAPYFDLQRPDIRYNAGYFARYAINPAANLYSEFQFSQDKTTARYDPASTALNTFGVNCNNPLLSAQEVDTLCTQNGLGSGDTASVVLGKRSVETGQRLDSFEHSSYRFVVGLKGQLDKVWSYDGYYQYGITNVTERLTNDLSLARVANGLNVVSVGGVPTCQSVVDGSDPACIPYNIFSLGGVTPAAANYVRASGVQDGFASREVVDGVLIGQLGAYGVKSPFADEGVGVVMGGEYRREALRRSDSASFVSGDLAVTGQQLPFAGSYTVAEGFGEAHIPLVSGLPLVQRLSLDLSDRYADYSLQGGVNAYKFGGDWAVDDDIRLRGSISQAIRAPNGFELFRTQTLNKLQIADPCAGPTPVASLAQCQNTGVTTAEYGNIPDTGNINYLSGGNTKLKPETAKTYTVGVVLTPRFIRGFAFSADYWNIKVKGYDGQYAPNSTLTACLNTGSPIFCPLVQRDASGSLSLGNGANAGRIIATNLNTGNFGESGIDLDSSYSLPLEELNLHGAGTLRFHFTGSVSLDNPIQPIPGGATIDCTGLYGPTCTGEGPTSPIPKWRHQLRATWSAPAGFEVSLNWRHIGELNSELGSSYGALQGTVFPVDARIHPFDYFDLAVTYSLNDHYQLRAGVDNIFGLQPPLAGSNANPLILGGNLVASIYDIYGRNIFVGITAKY